MKRQLDVFEAKCHVDFLTIPIFNQAEKLCPARFKRVSI